MTYNNGNRRDERAENNMLGWIVGALALAIVLGGLFFMMSDRPSTTASNTAPGVTTGSSTTTPASPAPATPPASPSR